MLCVVFAAFTAYLDDHSVTHEQSIIAKSNEYFIGNIWRYVTYKVSLLFVGHGNSIALLFLCENRTGLKNLVDLYCSGELRSKLEELFTSLFVADDPQLQIHIKKLVWELSDYCRCSLYFQPPLKREFNTSIFVDKSNRFLVLIIIVLQTDQFSHFVVTKAIVICYIITVTCTLSRMMDVDIRLLCQMLCYHFVRYFNKYNPHYHHHHHQDSTHI